ncbi:MAG: methyltransferase domain-containing protein [Gammaproteobacteria bacterium]|nr:MAG: methyltransferase domain-containing protein [Gammaproteobacteria bacterium]
MSCCCTPSGGIGKFFGHFARRYRRRYARRGFEPAQRQLIEGLRLAGFADASLLEIGCGVGYLHQQLLREGAGHALGVDISEEMLAQARLAARDAGLAGRTEYRQGDFVNIAGGIEPADVALLDKVVCCYPDAEALVTRSVSKTRRVYALTYPRDRSINRLGVRVLDFFLWLVRSGFRTYVHDPRRIESWIAAAGFKKRYENRTFLWLTQVYVRD